MLTDQCVVCASDVVMLLDEQKTVLSLHKLAHATSPHLPKMSSWNKASRRCRDVEVTVPLECWGTDLEPPRPQGRPVRSFPFRLKASSPSVRHRKKKKKWNHKNSERKANWNIEGVCCFLALKWRKQRLGEDSLLHTAEAWRSWLGATDGTGTNVGIHFHSRSLFDSWNLRNKGKVVPVYGSKSM